MDYARQSRVDALAAQYVTGTLRGRARARFESLLPGHPALREAVQAWQERLMPLTLAVAPVVPPARVWPAIEARLWPAAAAASVSRPGAWWQRLALWRGLSGLATAAVLALTVALVRTPPPSSSAGPPIVVVLEGQAGTAAAGATFVASVAGDGQSMVMQPVSVNVPLAPSDRVLELWSVPPQGQGRAPTSLGLINADGLTVLPRSRLPESLLKGGTAALAVSLEPPGGSPTGAPTGPVVFAGRLRI